MLYRIAADLLVVAHLGFIGFVVLGGFLALRWPWISVVHLPCAAWGALIEFQGWICPLTPLEQWLRRAAGEAGYAGGFVEHYLIPLIYPPGLTGGVQSALGILVVAVNLTAYGVLLHRLLHADRRPRG